MVSSTQQLRRQEREIATALGLVAPFSFELESSPRGGWDVRIADAIFHVRWVRFGWLPEIRDVLAEDPDVTLVVGPTISAGAREELARHGAGWVESRTGAARFAGGNVVVTTGPQFEAVVPRRSSWTPAALATCEALLEGTAPTVQAVSEATGMATGTASMSLSWLTQQGYLEASAARGPASGRRLTDPRRLLEAYSEAAQLQVPAEQLRVGVLWRDPVHALQTAGIALDHAGVRWAATGDLAAAVLAPFATSVTSWRAFIDADSRAELVAAARLLGAEPAAGGRLTLELPPTRWTVGLGGSVGGLRCAPWPRVFVDLRGSGVRGEDVAEHLAEQYLPAEERRL